MKIHINNLILSAKHGTLDSEKSTPQKFSISVYADFIDTLSDFEKDNLDNFLDYFEIRQIVREIFHGPSKNTLEYLCYLINTRVLCISTRIEKVSTKIEKLEVFDDCTPSVEVSLSSDYYKGY